MDKQKKIQADYLSAFRSANGQGAELVLVEGGFQVVAEDGSSTGFAYTEAELVRRTAHLRERAAHSHIGSDTSSQFILVTQLPKPCTVGLGVLSVGKDGDAHFFAGRGESGAQILATMKRCRMDYAAANGIMLSGMERTGVDRHGAETFTYQEWWLRYPVASASLF